MEADRCIDTIGSILESAPFPVLIARIRDGSLRYGNRRAATLLRFDLDTARGSQSLDFYRNPEDRARFLQALSGAGSLYDYEIELLDWERKPYWALMSASFIEYEGEPCIIVGINNIDAQKEIQRTLAHERSQLREREALVSTMYAQTTDCIMIVDASDGHFVEFNDNAHRGLGYTREEFSRLTVHDIHPPEALAEALALLPGVLSGTPASLETEMLARGEKRIAINLRMQAITYNEIQLVSTVWRDITDQKERERSAARTLRTYTDYSSLIRKLGTTKSRIEGNLDLFTREFTELASTGLGLSRVRVAFADHGDGTLRDPDDAAWAMDAAESRSLMASRFAESADPAMLCCRIGPADAPLGAVMFHHADRGHRWSQDEISFSCQLADQFGMAILNNQRNETLRELEQHRLHLEELVAQRTAELEAAMLEAQAANRAKSAFLSNMSHEIRTPMNAILGYAHLLRSGGLSPGQSDKLAKMSSSAEHLLGIINDILDIARIEVDARTLDLRDFEPAAIVADVVRLVSAEASSRDIRLSSTLERVPRILRGDAVRIRRILLNLVGNAVKFTEHGSVEVVCHAIPTGPERILLNIEVKDTGIGIAPEILARLFTAFEQADVSPTRRFGGAGLGLAISKKLVELMGGRIGAESAPGKGSRFWFEVPVQTVEGRSA